MRTRIPALAALCAVLVFASSAALAISPGDTVRRSDAADRNVSYKGIKTITTHVGKHVEVRVKVVHQKPNKTRTEYLSPKELAGIIAIEKGGDSWRFLPQKGMWEHERWRLDDENLKLAFKNYKIASGGTGSVAGRPAYIVKVIPKNPDIPSQKLWIDKQYYVVLKNEVRSPSGSLRSTSAFTSIEFNPNGISSSLFEPHGNVKDEPRAGAVDFNPIRPDYLPKGYVLVGIAPVKVNGGVSAHMQYTNGINTISIFQRKISKPANSNERVERKPNGITIITNGKGKLGFTVIGDIEPEELLRIARSLK